MLELAFALSRATFSPVRFIVQDYILREALAMFAESALKIAGVANVQSSFFSILEHIHRVHRGRGNGFTTENHSLYQLRFSGKTS
jgi:ABC-type transporter Mla MlaB component